MKRSVELFAGAGGLGIGVGRAGFHHAAVVEIDRYCRHTIELNRSRGQADLMQWPTVTTADVRTFDYRSIADQISLVSGGPPCQPFSLGGRHKAFADSRDMFGEAVRAVRELRPQAFVFENVKGLTRDRFASYLEYITLQMNYPEIIGKAGDDWTDHLRRLEQHHTSGARSGLQYRVVREILNAADYGVPQKRERVFFVGFRSDLGIRWGFPKATHTLDALLFEQKENGNYWDRHRIVRGVERLSARSQARMARLIDQPAEQPWVTVRDALIDLPEPSEISSSIANHILQRGARSYPGHTGSHLDEPAKALKAGVHGVPGGENMLLDPVSGKVRYFSVRESARLQTFPDDFHFHGCWSETMRQLGNAVPVRLAEIVATSVGRALEMQKRGHS